MNRPTRQICITAIALLGSCLAAHAQPIAEQDLTRLGSDSLVDIKKARVAIIDAIDDPKMATSERFDASDALIAPLKAMIESDDEIMVVNGLMIAGNIVTPDSIALIETAFESDKPGVRYAGLKALRSTFTILSTQRTRSLEFQEISIQIRAAADILKDDTDNFVAEGAARALIEAAKMRDSELSGEAEKAFQALAEAASSRLSTIDDVADDRKSGVLRIAMLSTFELGRVLQSGTNTPGREPIRQAAGLAGDSLAHVFSRFQAADLKIASMNESETIMLSQLIGASENLVYSAQSELGESAKPVALRQTFESGNDRDFNRSILTLIGGSGVLTRAPFSLKADRFVASGG
jgi:hypothetical protein